MPEPRWKDELREQLDALSGSYPDLHRVGPLRAVIVSLVEVHRTEAYRYGEMAERSRSGYKATRRKPKKEPPCPSEFPSAPTASASSASAGNE